LSGYFFGNFGDKASNIIWRYATLCWPVTDCKMNDHMQWRQREFKVGGDKALKEVGVRRGVPLPTGEESGRDKFFCFVV